MQIPGGSLMECSLGLLEVAHAAGDVDVPGVPSDASHPGQHGDGALEDPSAWVDDEYAAQQAVVGELSLQIGEMEPTLAGETAADVGQARRSACGVA